MQKVYKTPIHSGLLMKSKFEVNRKGGYVLVQVNPQIYPLDVALSAAYVMTEKNYILLDGEPSEGMTVEIRPKDKNANLEAVGREFHNELISYANYAVQSLRNEKLREAILNRVLLTNSEAAQDSLKSADEPFVFDDPLGIAIPWEEKYGKGKNRQK
jgi:His-Xaa-Ser system protein HxsD